MKKNKKKNTDISLNEFIRNLSIFSPVLICGLHDSEPSSRLGVFCDIHFVRGLELEDRWMVVHIDDHHYNLEMKTTYINIRKLTED